MQVAQAVAAVGAIGGVEHELAPQAGVVAKALGVGSALALTIGWRAAAGKPDGKVAVDESVRFAGPTTPSGGLEQDRGKGDDAEVRDLMRHVDGTDAIIALAKRAQEAGVGL